MYVSVSSNASKMFGSSVRTSVAPVCLALSVLVPRLATSQQQLQQMLLCNLVKKKKGFALKEIRYFRFMALRMTDKRTFSNGICCRLCRRAVPLKIIYIIIETFFFILTTDFPEVPAVDFSTLDSNTAQQGTLVPSSNIYTSVT